jgi:hypothetical protein
MKERKRNQYGLATRREGSATPPVAKRTNEHEKTDSDISA